MILVTGNTGYIGMVMTKFLQAHGYAVVGLDTNYYEGCDFFLSAAKPVRQIFKDVREVTKDDLAGVKSVIHLAALSNDPLGELRPNLTQEINYLASVRLAQLAKEAGAERFIFSSSCSLYGIAPDDNPLNEENAFNPVTVYAQTKVSTERALAQLAGDHFHPVFMRNATVYGVSPRLRLDLVVNNLVAAAFTTGRVSILSDGMPWRPIVHVEDFCRAFLAVLEAPAEVIHNQAFNVGINEENYRIKDIARRVERIVPGCQMEILNKTGADERTYRVDFSKIQKRIPEFQPAWNLDKGIQELYEVYREVGLTREDFESPKYFRVKWIKYLCDANRLNPDLVWEKVLI